MPIEFKKESFRPPNYAYSNSPHGIWRFPFPFDQDAYMYRVNIEPHTPGKRGSAYEFAFDVDEHYVAECEDRAATLKADPKRCVSLPHMLDAGWDTLELIMESLARDYPEHFQLGKQGNLWTWVNQPLNLRQSFTFGDASTLPCGPFEYIGRQAQGDFVLMDQREGNLWADAGMVTTQADWSMAFDLGMSFKEWHGPVPMAHELGVFDRALKFLLNLQQGAPVRRLNWTMTVNPRLDTAPEHYDQWGPDRTTLTPDNVAKLLHLRVELQSLFRLPRSNGILFGVRCYLCSLEQLATYPRWVKRLHRVLKTLPPPLVDYKGLTRYRDTAVAWLSQFDDGAALPAGFDPE
jgi:hypothetical protein